MPFVSLSFAQQFQSTLPARGATPFPASESPGVGFQSTLPARGATESTYHSSAFLQISIHAPRTGSDRKIKPPGCVSAISIHAPRTGSDHDAAREADEIARISIHAPRTGSDIMMRAISSAISEFQSTLPARGATHRKSHRDNTHGYFNPRSPHGERRKPVSPRPIIVPFQSTLPARGATRPLRLAIRTI